MARAAVLCPIGSVVSLRRGPPLGEIIGGAGSRRGPPRYADSQAPSARASWILRTGAYWAQRARGSNFALSGQITTAPTKTRSTTEGQTIRSRRTHRATKSNTHLERKERTPRPNAKARNQHQARASMPGKRNSRHAGGRNQTPQANQQRQTKPPRTRNSHNQRRRKRPTAAHPQPLGSCRKHAPVLIRGALPPHAGS